MADTYGVKVKLQYQTNKSDLRGQLQSLLDEATKSNPLYIHHFKVQKKGLRDALTTGFKEADVPLTLSKVALKLSANALNDLQSQLDAKDITLTIKNIKADQAVSNLRAQLVRMLSGLQISGVKEFLGGEELTQQSQAVENYAANLERLKVMQQQLRKSGAQILSFGTDSTALGHLREANAEYTHLIDLVTRAIAANGQWDDVDGLQHQVMEVNALIEAHKQYIRSLADEAAAQKKAADEVEAAAKKAAKTPTAEDAVLIQRLKDAQALLNQINKQRLRINVDQKQVDALFAKYQRLSEAITKANTDTVMRGNGHSVAEIESGVAALQQYIQKLREEAAAANITYASEQQLASLRNQITTWLSKNTRATETSRSTLQKYAAELSLGNVTTERYREITNKFKQINVATQQAGLSGKTFFQTFQEGLQKFGGWSIVTRTLSLVFRTIKNMISVVREQDSAMTELKKVTNLTSSEYREFEKTAAQTAKRIGASVSDTINATADFARLGYDVEEAAALAEAALIYKNIGDGIDDISQATESLTSTIKAFGYEATDAMYIVDMFNEVGNNFAISSVGIGDALQRSAAALAEGGNTLQESIGLIVAANEIIQDPDVVGTAMKTLTMYLRAAKTEAEDAGISTDGMANSVSELREQILQLTGQRVDIMIDDNTFKSTYKIMEELANIWSTLNDTTRSNILNLIGGKKNANTFSAMLQNFEQAANAMQTALGASGSALAENEKVMQSIEGKIIRAKASFEEFASTVIDSGMVKIFVDLLNVIINIGTWLAKRQILFPAIGALGQLASLGKAALQAKSFTKTLVQMKNRVLDVNAGVSSLEAAFMQLSGKQQKQFLQTLQNSSAFKQLDADTQNLILSNLKLSAAQQQQALQTLQNSDAFKNLDAGTQNLILRYSQLSMSQRQQALQTLQNSAAFQNLDANTQKLIQDYLQLSTSSTTLVGRFRAAKAQISATSVGASAASVNFKAFGVTIKGAWSAMSLFSKASIILTVVSLVYQGISTLVNSVKENNEEALNTIEELISTYQDGVNTISNNKKTLESLREEYDELSQGVDENGESVSLTKDEYERYLDIVAQIAELSPEVVAKYDNEQRAVLLYADAIDIAIGKQEELAKAQRDTLLAQGEAIFDNVKSSYQSQIRDLQRSMPSFIVDTLYSGSLMGFNPTGNGYYDKDGAVRAALRAIGIYNFDTDDFWSNHGLSGSDHIPFDTIESIVRNREEFIASLRSSGEYAEEELAGITSGLSARAVQLQALDDIEIKQVEYLMAYSQNQNWYKNVPSESIDEFRTGLFEINDPLKLYTENMAAAAEYGEQFVYGLNWNNAGGALNSLAEQVRAGEFSAETYRNNADQHFDRMVQVGQISAAAASALKSYFYSLIESENAAGNATANFTQDLDSTSEAMASLAKRAELLNTAQQEIASTGSISSSTLSDMIDVMSEGEDVLDYLIVENGMLKLNEDAWRQRMDTIANTGVSGWQSELSALQTILDAEDSRQAYTIPDGYESLDEVRARVALLSEIIPMITGIGDASSGAAGDVKTLADAINGIDTASKLLTSIENGDSDVLGMIEQAMKMAETLDNGLDWTQFVSSFTADGGIVWNTEAIRAYSDSIIDAALNNSTLEATFPGITQWLKDFSVAEAEAEQASTSLADALSAVDDAVAFRDAMNSGETSVLDMIERAQAMADELNQIVHLGKTDWSWMQFADPRSLSGGLDDIVWSDAALRAYTDAIVDSYAKGSKMTAEQIADWKELAFQEAQATLTLQDFTNELSKLESAASVFQSINEDMDKTGYLSIDTLSSLIGLVGDQWLNMVDVTTQGFSFKQDASIADWVNEQVDALAKSEAFIEKYGDQADEVAAAMKSNFIAMLAQTGEAATEAADPIAKLTERLSQAESIMGLISQAQDDMAQSGKLSINTIQSMIDTFGSDWTEMLSFDGENLTPDFDKMQKKLTQQINLLDLSEFGEDAALVREKLHEMFTIQPETVSSFEKLQDVMGKTESAANLLAEAQQEIATTGTNSLSTLQAVMNLFGEDWAKYITFTAEGFAVNSEAIKQYIIDLVEALDVEESVKQSMKDSLNVALDKATAYEALSTAIDRVNAASSLLTNIQSGDGDTLSMIEQAAQMAEDSQGSISDFVNVVGGELVWSEEAIKRWATSSVDALSEFVEITPELRQYLIDLTAAEIEAAIAAEQMVTAYDNAKNALTGVPARGDLVELTYDAYNELIAIDSRYASAVQYQNGVLTLNRDRYAAVTQEILRTTKAQAAANMQTIIASEEYRNLVREIGNLSPEQQAKLDSLNAEIMGYQVLINELDNVTSAYNRFISASTETDSGRYSAAEQAREVIENTLYNAESDIYGKIGREQYVAAMDFLIAPNIEVGTDEFDAALATIDRYLEEGSAGVRNFYDDLVTHGFIDGNGVLNASMAEMASTLGVSMEFLRSMFDELNMYQDEEHQIKIDYDTGNVEAEAQSAEEQLAALQEQVTNLNTTLDVDHEVIVDVSAAETNLGKVSSAITTIIDKLTQLNGTHVTTYVNTVQTTTSPSSTSTRGGKPGLPSVSGLAAADGTDNAAGGRTLVGERGMETVVDPTTGTWYTVGRNGAEFINLPKGAIVFNAEQTKRLFAAGRISGRGEERGRAMAAGGIAGGMGALSPFVSMITADGQSFIPSLVDEIASGVVSAVSDQATGTPVIPPAGIGNNDTGGSGNGSPEDKLGNLSDEFDEINKYMEHLIRHQEHLYEVAENGLDFPGMESSLTEQIRIYKQLMAKAQSTVQAMIAAGADDTNEELQKVEEAYWSAYTSMYDVIDELNALYVDALNDKIDGIQSGYDNFSTLLSEMSEDGKLSVDTFQQLLEHGVEYLNYLELVDGQYVINTEALEEMLAAEKEQLAIEQALAYVSQIRQALMDDDPEKVAALVNLTNQISDGTWDLVYANAAYLKTLGLTDEQYADVLHNIDMMKDLADKVNTSLGEGTQAYEDQEAALDKILDYTEQLIKYETEEKIKAIEDEIDAYQELVDLRKEALQTAREESEYTDQVADKTKEIASLEARIAQLSLDDSREARAERAALEEELAGLQGELADVQSDHAYDLQVEALDQDAENYRTTREAEIAELEEMISSAEKLYQLALQRIDTDWGTLYNELIAWNIEAGSVLNSEITSNWDLALEAAKRYGSYVEAVIARTGNPMVITPVETSELPVYHDGGVVSATGVDHNEVVAVLEEDEAVLTQKQRTGLYRIVDFAKELSARLGTAIREITLPFQPMLPAITGVDGVGGAVVSNQNSMVFSPEINVQITHSGNVSDADARSFGRQIGSIAMQEMQQAFERRGISGIFGSGLKQ